MSYENHFKKIKKKSSGPKQTKSEPMKKNIKAKRRAKNDNTPWGLFIILLMGAIVSLWGYQNLDQVDDLISRVEIGFLGQASAQEQMVSAPSLKGENISAGINKEITDQCPPGAAPTSEELSHYNKLAERKQELDLREQELAKVEDDLQNQKSEIEVQIAKLEEIRTDISGILRERVEVDEKRVTTLVDFYSNMKPKQAADIFNKLNEDLAVEVLGRMKKKNAAAIMNLLEPAKAKTLSEKFTGYKKR